MSGTRSVRPAPRVTLLTDFGTRDGYAAAMKGVIVSRCPHAIIDDLTHEIPAGDIRAGAFALATAGSFFPPGTVHVAVVDPGVGTARAGILVLAREQVFIGPDNGLLSLAAGTSFRAYRLDQSQYFREPVSATFHGRDVFASVAGHIAAGTLPARVGSAIDDLTTLALPSATYDDAQATGEVIHVDRFGDLVTNLRADRLPREALSVTVDLGGNDLGPLVPTYGAVATGRFAALIGSSGFLEIAVRDGSAAVLFGPLGARGAPVRVRWELAPGCRVDRGG